MPAVFCGGSIVSISVGTITYETSGHGNELVYVELATGMPLLGTHTLQLESTGHSAGAWESLCSISVTVIRSIRRR